MKTAILAGAILATVALNAFAIDVVIEGGGGLSVNSPIAERIGLRFPTKWSWLNTEVGVLGTRHGGILDVTPMIHLFSIGKDGWVEGGIGLGDNFINDSKQSQGLIFHDVLRVGYKQFFVEAAHYSNGGNINPLFGSSNNSGYTYLMAGAVVRF